MKKIISFFLAIMFVFLCIGCNQQDSVETGKVNVIISKDFGNKELSKKNVDFSKDLSVMEVMEENFKVETAYGGGFINAIDGLKSGFTGVKDKKKKDWFYYVNGILAQVGAEDYYLTPNDFIIWDYHDWDNNIYGSSIIGAYPMNFTNGQEGDLFKTEILHTKEYEKESQEVSTFLKKKGLENIDVKNLKEEGLENIQTNTIVIGTWEEISQIDYLKDFYKNGNKTGLFFRIEKDIQALNSKGNITDEYEKGAVITSMVKEYGVSTSIWLVTGNDEKCIKKAVKLLYETPEKIKGKFSIIVTENEMINIPTNK
ncbi:DUF4430 domain-containing protein [Lutibacter sp. B2]|nr:DUF4430 domain-containing protein [Lutibacter sp. B2]